ncbi:hypothetical protein OAV41_01655 [Planctomycetota bacterium]|nr:hypothetical protein [Planctomycetota bacterium]
MEVTHYEDNGDGSVTIQVVMEDEEVAKILELGFVTALKNYIEEKGTQDEESS